MTPWSQRVGDGRRPRAAGGEISAFFPYFLEGARYRAGVTRGRDRTTSVPAVAMRTRPSDVEPSLPQSLAFVVQLSGSARGGQFCGRVSHVASARSARFASREECLAFIARVLEERPC